MVITSTTTPAPATIAPVPVASTTTPATTVAPTLETVGPSESETPTDGSVAPGDWANYTYPLPCLGYGEPEIVLEGGEQQAASANDMIYARLESAETLDDGSTLVTINCVVAADQYGYQAALIDPSGAVVDQLSIPSVESSDGSQIAVSAPEGWETGANPRDAASVQLYELTAEGGTLNLIEQEMTPKCAALGSQDAGRSDGPETNQQGALVRALHQRLNDLGHGKKITDEENDEGTFGNGTAEALSDYIRDQHDITNRAEPAPWFGSNDGSKVTWLDIAWTEALELSCVGEYRPIVPNESS